MPTPEEPDKGPKLTDGNEPKPEPESRSSQEGRSPKPFLRKSSPSVIPSSPGSPSISPNRGYRRLRNLPVGSADLQPLDLARSRGESKFELDTVKTGLYAYCKELENDLNQQTGIAKKYYSVLPDTLTPENKAADEKARQEFIELDFDNFFAKLISTLERLPKEYLYESFKRLLNNGSSATSEYSENDKVVQEFRDYVEKLNKAGFYSANGKPIHYWSGAKGRDEAYNSDSGLADSTVPSISVVCKLGLLLKSKSEEPGISEEVQQKYRALADKVFLVCSGELAAQTTGDVYVFSDASTKNEKEPRFTNNNFHWDIELPILQTLRLLGIVKTIYISDYSQAETKLLAPTDYNSPAYRTSRRLAERHDSIVGATLPQKKKDRQNFQEHGAERPGVLIDTVGTIAKHWKKVTVNKRAVKNIKPESKRTDPIPTTPKLKNIRAPLFFKQEKEKNQTKEQVKDSVASSSKTPQIGDVSTDLSHSTPKSGPGLK